MNHIDAIFHALSRPIPTALTRGLRALFSTLESRYRLVIPTGYHGFSSPYYDESHQSYRAKCRNSSFIIKGFSKRFREATVSQTCVGCSMWNRMCCQPSIALRTKGWVAELFDGEISRWTALRVTECELGCGGPLRPCCLPHLRTSGRIR